MLNLTNSPREMRDQLHAIHHHPAISGPCVECGHETTSIVKSTPTKAEFLCPPCGRAIREAI